MGRTEIGAIRIAANESYFQVTERATQSFVKALKRAIISPEDEGMLIEVAEPRELPQAGPQGRPRPAPPPKSSFRPEAAPKVKRDRKPRANRPS